MQANQAAQFYKSLKSLAELYDRTLTANVLELYFGALSDLTLEDATEACKQAALTLKFFPKPVELRELVAGTMQDQADKAWALLMAALDQGAGQYHSAYIDDGALAGAIVRCWGGLTEAFRAMSALGADSPMYASNRNAFRTAYASCRGLAGQYFYGSNEVQNRNIIWPTDREDTVFLLGEVLTSLRMPFSGQNGELLPAAKRSLMAMNGDELLPFILGTRPRMNALPEASQSFGELLPMPDEVRTALKQLGRRLTLVKPEPQNAEEAA